MVELTPRRRFVTVAGFIFGIVSGGCGPRLPLHQVTGTVTLDGRPLGGVIVMFQPEAGPGAMDMTDASGRYDLQTPGRGRGAAAGRHSIWIEVPAADGPEPIGESAVPLERKPIVELPARYLGPSTSGFHSTVSPTHNRVDLELVSNRISPP
jgi:hypothetical protein